MSLFCMISLNSVNYHAAYSSVDNITKLQMVQCDKTHTSDCKQGITTNKWEAGL